jgi:endonuclease/exonuclease/phosphatase family metal-dependent hydrolase
MIALLTTLFVSSTFATSVSIMTYNAENLFDTTHDKGKKDYTWLPLKIKQHSKEIQKYCASMRSVHYRRNCFQLDWSEETLDSKIQNLARVILSYNRGKGADIIVFEEVENINALNLLVKKGLFKKGYKYISLIEGPDTRGIDIGMISRYPITSEKLHKVDISKVQKGRTTRGILEVTFKVKNKTVTVFGNHWPSQGNNDQTRLVASKVLAKKAKLVKSDLVVATGDFNQTKSDLPHGINTHILPIFEDVEVLGRKFSTETSIGTHWYRGEWESLDRIFVLKSSLKNKSVYVDYSSFDIINKNFMVQDLEWIDFDTGAVNFDENIPWRFNAKTHEGFSDHLPVAIKINL